MLQRGRSVVWLGGNTLDRFKEELDPKRVVVSVTRSCLAVAVADVHGRVNGCREGRRSLVPDSVTTFPDEPDVIL